MLIEDTPPTETERVLLAQINTVLRSNKSILTLLAHRLNKHINKLLDICPIDEPMDIAGSRTRYVASYLGWNGRAGNRLCPHPEGALVLLRNGVALNNERTHSFTVDNVVYKVTSDYIDAHGKAVYLGREEDLEAFWAERTALLAAISIAQRRKHNRLAALIDSIPDLSDD